MGAELGFDWIVLSPAGAPDVRLPIAGSRAGAIGVLDLEFASDADSAVAALARLASLGRGRCGALVEGDSDVLPAILAARIDGVEAILLASADPDRLTDLVASIHDARCRAFLVATSLEAALAGEAAGIDAVIAKGHEAGGWVGDESTFVLLQQCLAQLETPVWAHGGIGLHTAAACYVAGAAGAVLDSQVLLARETPLPESVQAELRTMDGSETVCLGAELGARIRVFSRPALAPVADLQRAELTHQLTDADDAGRGQAWRTDVRGRVDWQDLSGAVLAVGQDAAFAADLARRFSTVGGIVTALNAAIADQCRSVAHANPLAESGPLARSHGTRYPIAQGPMTRVSDRAEFAAAVAEAGALPFLALALMRGPDVATLLEETKRLLGDRPWGAGILGFVPPELREEQLEAIRAHPPPFALIAGGRPDQAQALERDGISTYLHVPSPGLLELYLADGARRFVFEGRECGGHVGPRSSFVLWDTMVRTLLDRVGPAEDAGDYHVLFAGGIHDGLSAAMVAAVAAPLAECGMNVGVLAGTAYLFTEEAVRSGAITPTFQEAAISGSGTVLLETGPGHATRCLASPFVDEFRNEKLELRRSDVGAEELRTRLELLNMGRLRIAAKGVDRNPRFAEDKTASKLVALETDEQWTRGMFMIGQVAGLRDRVCTLAELHDQIVAGAAARIDVLALPEAGDEPAAEPADVAVVGIGSIFPGAADVETFWANVLDGVDAITEIPPERWDWRQYFDPDRTVPDKVYSRWGGFIDPVPFDPVAFGMPPNSLRSIEPFQLLGLLVAGAALRDAGYADRPFPRERTSVIFGAGGGGADLSVGYTVRSSLPKLFGEHASQLTEDLGDALPEWTEDSFAGLLMNVVAGRIANRFDLGGTNYTVDAACASSLASIALAVREIQSGTSDMAVVGGIDAIQNPFAYLCFAKTQALSPSGRCRPFDAEADGIAISEGFAAVVLKRVSDAERDGDRIYAVIRGVGSASDGRDRSLTAPRPEGQMRALRRAYAHAGFSPATVGLVEAHGTGTVAGDRAEVEALSTVFAEAGATRQSSALGSVKSLIGHTKAAAGVAGFIKAALALHHRVLPPTIGVTNPNPKADFPASPFYVNTETRPWVQGVQPHPRRAGISAFGFGGTDFHVVLEEYTGGFLPDHEPVLHRWPAELFLWRGVSGTEVVTQVDALATELEHRAELEHSAEPALADLAYTLALQAGGSGAGPASLAIVADSLPDLARKLKLARELIVSGGERHHTPDGVHYAERPLAAEGEVAFLFPGQGSQSVNMARDLAVVFPEVRECFERGDRILAECHDRPLSSYVFPPPVFSPEEEQEREAALTDTHVAQPALGVTDIAYLHVLQGFGVEPQLVAGHSYGEFVALAAAGSLNEDDLLRLSEARGRFISEDAGVDSGTMAAVDAAPEALRPLLDDPDLVFANLNAPEQTVISGGRENVERAVARLTEQGLRARLLPVACAFHSPYVEPARRRLAERLAHATITSPRIPVFSNTTAGPYPDDPAEIARILGEHLIRPVEFNREIDAMYEAGARIFVEVGPRAVLSGLVGRILEGRTHVAVPVDQPGRAGLAQLLHCLAALVSEGVAVQTPRLFDGRPVRRLKLRGLEPVEGSAPVSAATWLVDGGRAQPASEARRVPVPVEFKTPVAVPAPVPVPQPIGVNMNTESNQTDGSRGEAILPAQPVPVAASPSPALAGERAGDVMNRHMQLMQHFLETQKAVVLAYLGQPRATDAVARPAEIVARPDGETRLALPPQPAPQPALPPQPAPPQPAPQPVIEMTPVVEPVTSEPAFSANGHHSLADDLAEKAGALGANEIRDRLLEVVSERTGYPPDMLELDADLEADLGIDSIKRVEIVGTMIQSLSLSNGVTPDVEEITSSRTLRQAIAALEALANHGKAATTPAEVEPSPFDQARADEAGSARASIGRYVVQTATAPPVGPNAPLAGDGVVVIVDDETGVGEQLADRLRLNGDRVVRIVSGTAGATGPELVAGDLADPAAVSALLVELAEQHGSAKGLVYLPALGRGPAANGSAATDRDLVGLFLLSRGLGAELETAADSGGAVVLGATAMGGAFALDGADGDFRPDQGAIAGFLKSFAHERPSVRVKAVDLAPGAPAELADVLLAELLAGDGVVEVGYRDGERRVVEVLPRELNGRPEEPPLDRDSVVLITGGARGITAETALTLAERYTPTLVLVGRTSPPAEEDAQTAGLTDPRELRQAILDRLRADGAEVTPAVVEGQYRELVGSREVRTNLQRLRATGARVEYLTCDVRDGEALGALIDGVYDAHGRIDGVVHGAGVIEDKLVVDKELESFERVVDTKAGAAHTIVGRLRPDSLRFLVFFSSVAGRFGNRGQGDYAAASEVLNKLAQELDRRWAARVVSINWGPWRKAGMVSPELEQEFERRGVKLIPIDLGCRSFDEELRLGRKGEAEVVIGGVTGLAGAVANGAAPSAAAAGGEHRPLLGINSSVKRTAGGTVEVVRALDPDDDLYLADHCIDGRPVLPFAVAMELMAETAAAGHPDLEVAGLRQIRVLQGVTVDDGYVVQVLAAPQAGSAADVLADGAISLETTITALEGARPHYRAIVDLRRPEQALRAVAVPEPLAGLPPFPMTVAEAYRDLLFHGPRFQRIASVEGMDERGASAVLLPAPPATALSGSPTTDWILDPVLVDCALQLQVIWARLHWDVTLLPGAIGSAVRLSTEPFPEDGVRLELRIRSESVPPLCTSDHSFFAPDGTLLATMTNAQGVGSKALNRLGGHPAVRGAGR